MLAVPMVSFVSSVGFADVFKRSSLPCFPASEAGGDRSFSLSASDDLSCLRVFEDGIKLMI